MYSQNSKGNYCSTAVRSAIGKRKYMLLHYKFQAPQVVDFSGQTSFFFFFQFQSLSLEQLFIKTTKNKIVLINLNTKNQQKCRLQFFFYLSQLRGDWIGMDCRRGQR